MITVYFEDRKPFHYPDLNWTLDDGKTLAETVMHNQKAPLGRLSGITADGEELVEINKRFTGIPKSTGERVWWTGETARFIILNM